MGGEGTGWALDADAQTTRAALSMLGNVQFVSLAEADVVHAVWEYPLLSLDAAALAGKRIVCHLPNDAVYTFMQGCMARARRVGLWVPMSRRAEADCKALGLRSTYVPYAIDPSLFTAEPPDGLTRDAIRQRWGIPLGGYVVSSFMRDSTAHDLHQAKPQKGVEAFVCILKELHRRGHPIHVLLAGPRRHWIRARLTGEGIPFTFVGQVTESDDNSVNILPAETVNLLYHASDLHLITSRWEGGPRAVLEGAATRTPLLSTPVGMAADVLGPECLFRSVDEAVGRIESDLRGGNLRAAVGEHLRTVRDNHVPSANTERFRQLYVRLDEIPIFRPVAHRLRASARRSKSLPARLIDRAICTVRRRPPDQPGRGITFGFWHEFHKPPYGGGNQFMMALRPALERLGARVLVNRVSPRINVQLLNSAWFQAGVFEMGAAERRDVRVLHRVDGPIGVYRGTDMREDDRIYDLNRRYASATIYQSGACFKAMLAHGYQPVAPVVIRNAVDGRIFHPARRSPGPRPRIRLISTAWSDNPRKGGPIFKWLDEHLDLSRYEYTFVGRVKETLRNIRHISPQASRPLARLLRDHDIYIMASEGEACSNALIEALACGLPVLYLNSGGNPELVGMAGLSFESTADLLSQLDAIACHIDDFRQMVYVDSIETVARRYIEVAQVALESALPTIE